MMGRTQRLIWQKTGTSWKVRKRRAMRPKIRPDAATLTAKPAKARMSPEDVPPMRKPAR